MTLVTVKGVTCKPLRLSSSSTASFNCENKETKDRQVVSVITDCDALSEIAYIQKKMWYSMKDHRVTFFKLIFDILMHKNIDQERYYIICLALSAQRKKKTFLQCFHFLPVVYQIHAYLDCWFRLTYFAVVYYRCFYGREQVLNDSTEQWQVSRGQLSNVHILHSHQ